MAPTEPNQNHPPPPATPPPDSDPETFTHILTYHETRCMASPLYAFLLSRETHGLRLTHASKGLVRFRLRLAACHLNSSGSLHGSVAATAVDWAGGLAVAAWDLRAQTGVSVDIHVSYLAGARLGQVVEVEGRVDRVGGSLAFTTVEIWKVDGLEEGVEDLEGGKRGDCVVLGRHTKYVRSRS